MHFQIGNITIQAPSLCCTKKVREPQIPIHVVKDTGKHYPLVLTDRQFLFLDPERVVISSSLFFPECAVKRKGRCIDEIFERHERRFFHGQINEALNQNDANAAPQTMFTRVSQNGKDYKLVIVPITEDNQLQAIQLSMIPYGSDAEV